YRHEIGRQGLSPLHRLSRRAALGRICQAHAAQARDGGGRSYQGHAAQKQDGPRHGQEAEGIPRRQASASGAAAAAAARSARDIDFRGFSRWIVWDRETERLETRNEKLDLMADQVQFYGTGRRKSSVARVFLRPGSGDFKV